MATRKAADHDSEDDPKRKYLSQTDVPSFGLTEALRIPQAIADNYGKNPTKPMRVAEALNMLPQSSRFRQLCGASVAYGLTDGGYNSEVISLTPLGRRVVAPTKEGDDLAAKREAFLRPRVVRDFLTRYNESKMPNATIAHNVLEELGVPRERSADVFVLITQTAGELGFLRELKGLMYVDLDQPSGQLIVDAEVIVPHNGNRAVEGEGNTVAEEKPTAPLAKGATRPTNRVFITHGKNMEIVAQLKELLSFGGFTPVIALENETVAKPVPDKVMDDMRSCDAAIIHVGSEQKFIDVQGHEQKMLNQNVLIEIGAAMALYGRKFILLVEREATLPSNLQGLYEVRYTGSKLDYESTMKLLKAFNDFRS